MDTVQPRPKPRFIVRTVYLKPRDPVPSPGTNSFPKYDEVKTIAKRWLPRMPLPHYRTTYVRPKTLRSRRSLVRSRSSAKKPIPLIPRPPMLPPILYPPMRPPPSATVVRDSDKSDPIIVEDVACFETVLTELNTTPTSSGFYFPDIHFLSNIDGMPNLQMEQPVIKREPVDVTDPSSEVEKHWNRHGLTRRQQQKQMYRSLIRERCLPMKNRTVFTDSQQSYLRAIYKENKFIRGEQRTMVARRLGLSEEVVGVWFKNQRSKARKSMKFCHN